MGHPNAERLHTIAIAIRADIQSTKALTYLQHSEMRFRIRSANPKNPATSNKAIALKRPAAALPKRRATPSSAWQQVVAEIGGTHLGRSPDAG
jgi:hypothetical protein